LQKETGFPSKKKMSLKPLDISILKQMKRSKTGVVVAHYNDNWLRTGRYKVRSLARQNL